MISTKNQAEEQLTLPPGTTVRDARGASFVIEGLLGKGGFGAVYVVRDRHVKSKVYALKELSGQDRLDRECFLFEGELLRRLDHHALPHVYSVFENKKLQRVYMLMDYIEGRNLNDLRKEQPQQRFALSEVLAMLEPVVEALTYLHSQDPPVVHRDIKPGNIIVRPESHETILVDFGTAKEYESEATTTVVRYLTSGYAAPEQYMGGTTPRTDIYGLGATIYALLSGKTPPDALVRATRSGGSDPLSTPNLVVPGVPQSILRIIRRAMSLNSENRYESVEEFWQQLKTHAPQQSECGAEKCQERAVPQVPMPKRDMARVVVAADARTENRSTKRRAFQAVILALFLIAAGCAGLLLHAAGSDPASLAARSIAPTEVVRKAPTTQVPAASIYPPLAVSYGGTIGDIMTNESTALYLTGIRQQQGSIQGSFQGLGLLGSFKGTVTASGRIHFTVTVYAGQMTLMFEGTIKIGGDLAGSFEVLNQQGQRTGEAGLWNVAPGN